MYNFIFILLVLFSLNITLLTHVVNANHTTVKPVKYNYDVTETFTENNKFLPIENSDDCRANMHEVFFCQNEKTIAAKSGQKTSWTSSDRKKAWIEKGRQDGKAPKREVLVQKRKTGEIEVKTESKELHHKKPRSQGGGNESDNLEEVWPSEHEAIDPNRHTGYDVLEIFNE